jgi:putative transposase
VIKSFKYRIYPTRQQVERLDNWLAVCAELYNAALQERREAWKSERKHISRFDQIYQLPEIRQERGDVADVNANVLEDVITRVDKAFKAFFRRCRDGQSPGYPRFRSVRRYDSLTFRQIGNAVTVNTLRLSKIGKVRITLHRPIKGTIKTLTVKREDGKWFAVFACEVGTEPLPFNPNMIGVDVGLTHFATLSDGTQIDNPRYYRRAERALRVAQRRVARRKKGSNRRRKAIVLLQCAHAHIRQQRANFLHNLSRGLINNNGLIAAEKLNIKGMVRGPMAKSISDAGWGQFLNFIAYKAEEAGRVFVQVNPNGTSQTCICGEANRKTLADRWHSCLACGLSLDRDHVSAQVILGRGLRLQALTSPTVECVA